MARLSHLHDFFPSQQPYWQTHYPRWLESYTKYTMRESDRSIQLLEAIKLLSANTPQEWQGRALRLLDLGIGDGRLCANICNLLRHDDTQVNVYGMDIDEECIRQANAQLDNAVLAQGDIFTADLNAVFPQAMPVDLALVSHAMHLVTVPYPRPMEYPAEVHLVQAFINFWEQQMLPCLAPSSIACFLHVSPISLFLSQAFHASGAWVTSLPGTRYAIHFPKLNDAHWALIAEGRISSTEPALPELQAAQDAQHLLEISIMVPLSLLSDAERKMYVKARRKHIEEADYQLTRTEELSFFTLRDATPSVQKVIGKLQAHFK